MQDLIQTLIYGSGGYAATYVLLRPAALIDAVSTGPGMGKAGWAFHHKHYKLTYPVLGVMLVVLGLVVAQVT
ncbi:hypothetical protein MUY35_15840 [Aliiroseovarius sp. S1339]|uniref:hypothetical protein n=1 Tax=Aliiroseovarius sp. S1339 TaxID=2936990 RepID=UPI0020BE457B|nr:hypothetical protein [Aliiroseovarius sp. S1339]MCK8465331.1 hypothetical protein [Aliiroseovarius sp. S1339]